jgi:EAL domain-containing protein (putative c-di-GMP-specific phosphodiesterase class I)
VDTNAQSAAIVRSIIGLGQALKIPVIAEGVETESERSFLWQEGCTEIQGFLIGHPLPMSAYASLIGGADSPEHAARTG